MSKIITFLKKQPTLAAAVLSLIGAVLGMFIDNPAMVTALVAVFASLLGIHHVVTPVVTMVERVNDAANIAATEVAKQLDATTVGAPGELITGATEIVENVIDLTVDTVLNGGNKK